MNLRSRLTLTMFPAILVAIGLLAWDSIATSRRALLDRMDREVQATTRARAEELDRRFTLGSQLASNLALGIHPGTTWNAPRMASELKDALEQTPLVLGITLALDPGATPLGPYAHYVHRDAKGIHVRSLAGEDYRYQQWDWYTRPMTTGRPGWGAPYLDGALHVWMITYSALLREGDRTVGVVSVDLSLEDLERELKAIHRELGASAFLASREGEIRLTHAGGPLELSPRVKALLRTLTQDAIQSCVEMPDPVTSRPSWVVERPIASVAADTGWSLVLAYPTEPLFVPVRQLAWRLAIGAGVVIGLVFLVIHALARTLTRPVQDLVAQAARYGEGRFGERIREDQGPREIRELSSTFNHLGGDILRQMEEIRTSTEQGERYRQELAIAAEFQRDILPASFPPFPDLVGDLDLYGVMHTAKEMGGDFYDLFRLPNGHLVLVVADVSGKGAPAALFMTQAHLLIRFLARQELPPSEVMRRANLVLEEEAAGRMFVTAAYVDLDPATGRGELVSAGHPSPVLLCPGQAPAEIAHPRAMPLAACAATQYRPALFHFPRGASLLLYSDGLSETMDARGEEFGTGRILDALASAPAADCEAIAGHLVATVKAFAGAEPIFDDLTILLARRLEGPGHSADGVDAAGASVPAPSLVPAPGTGPLRMRLELPGDLRVLTPVAQFLEHFASEAGLGPEDTQRLLLSSDEVITNVIEHAYPGDPRRTFLVDLDSVPGGLRVVVTDTGVPFDFDTAANRYTGKATIDQAPGGIGLFLARTLLDEFRYEPGTLHGNRVVMVKLRSDA